MLLRNFKLTHHKNASILRKLASPIYRLVRRSHEFTLKFLVVTTEALGWYLNAEHKQRWLLRILNRRSLCLGKWSLHNNYSGEKRYQSMQWSSNARPFFPFKTYDIFECFLITGLSHRICQRIHQQNCVQVLLFARWEHDGICQFLSLLHGR